MKKLNYVLKLLENSFCSRLICYQYEYVYLFSTINIIIRGVQPFVYHCIQGAFCASWVVNATRNDCCFNSHSQARYPQSHVACLTKITTAYHRYQLTNRKEVIQGNDEYVKPP